MAKADYDLIAIQKKLKKNLDKPRFHHTLGVMYTAASLAMVHDCDLEQVQMAGLLHDCAKCIPDEKKIKLCQKYEITITAYEKNHPFMLHTKLGAFIATQKYGIKDSAILEGILWHTTGKPSMSTLEKIIYIADYIEPGRDRAPNLDQIRKTAFQSLDECMYLILKDALAYLSNSGMEIDIMSENAFDYYSNIHNQGGL